MIENNVSQVSPGLKKAMDAHAARTGKPITVDNIRETMVAIIQNEVGSFDLDDPADQLMWKLFNPKGR